jgi:hypothetical protein
VLLSALAGRCSRRFASVLPPCSGRTPMTRAPNLFLAPIPRRNGSRPRRWEPPGRQAPRLSRPRSSAGAAFYPAVGARAFPEPTAQRHPASSVRCRAKRTLQQRGRHLDHTRAPTPEPLECQLRLIRHTLARHSLYLSSYLIAQSPSHHLECSCLRLLHAPLLVPQLLCPAPVAAAPPEPFQLPAWANPPGLPGLSRKGVRREAADPLPR